MITAILTMDNENDFALLKSYAESNGGNIKIINSEDIEDEIFAKIMLEEQTGETMTLQSFVELVKSEN